MINNKIKSFLVFIIFFTLFFITHSSINGFVTRVDPYYHAKHAYLIEQSGQLDLVEPWLEFHIFNYAPVDPWWGFHLGMALFIHWFGPILGVKIFVSFLAALVFLVFYLILSNLKIKYPAVWVVLLFFSSTVFNYRLFLERPHLLSIIVLPLAFLFVVKGKNFWLFILSLFYTLSYHLVPPIILLILIYLVVDAYYNKRINLKPLIATAGGLLAGIIIHPYSLNYLYVIFITSFRILFLKFSGIDLGIGDEIQPFVFFSFLQENFLGLCFYVLALVIFLSLKKHNSNPVVSGFLFLYSSLWFIVTLVVQRGVEYWLPAAILFAAFVFNDFLKTEEFGQIKYWLANKVNFKVIGFFLISLLVLIIFRNIIIVFGALYYNKTGEVAANYEQANVWLKANTEKDSVVFYDHYGMWPMMFFYNNYNHYIHGIDPTFLYEYDPRTYWLWYNISSQGRYCDQPKPCFTLSLAKEIKYVPLAIKTVFRAKYAVVSNYEDSNLIKTLNNLRTEVKLVFRNKDLLIYEME